MVKENRISIEGRKESEKRESETSFWITLDRTCSLRTAPGAKWSGSGCDPPPRHMERKEEDKSRSWHLEEEEGKTYSKRRGARSLRAPSPVGSSDRRDTIELFRYPLWQECNGQCSCSCSSGWKNLQSHDSTAWIPATRSPGPQVENRTIRTILGPVCQRKRVASGL